MRRSILLLALTAVVFAAFFSAIVPVDAEASDVKVFVSILPQRYFVQRIGGDRVDVSVMVQPGHSPHSYEPTPRQMANLSRASLYFSIGVTFERAWMPRIAEANPDLRIVSTIEGIRIRANEGVEYLFGSADSHHSHGEECGHHGHHDEEGHHQDHHGDCDHHSHDEDCDCDHDAHHHHDHEDGHSHDCGDHDHHHDGHEHGHHHDHEDGCGHSHEAGEPDPHVWLDPILVAHQAEIIAAALAEVDPTNAEYYQENLKAFQADLYRVNAELAAALAGLSTREFMVFHPAFGYFADRYGLRQIPIEIEGKEPAPRVLAQMIEFANERDIKVVFVQAQFSSAAARSIAEAIDGRVVQINPLAEDYLENLRALAETLVAELN